MNWKIDFSSEALKFLAKNRISESDIVDKIKTALHKFGGEDVNIDIKKLGGVWDGFYRIRIGRLRIIAEFKFDAFRAYIEIIDWRGNAYKK